MPGDATGLSDPGQLGSLDVKTFEGLWAELQALSSTAREERHVVQRGRHRIAYVIYTVRLPHL